MGRTSLPSETPPHNPVKVVTLRLVNKHSVAAMVDIDTGCGFIIKDFVLLDEPGQAHRIMPPTTQNFDRQGRRFYKPILDMNHALKATIDQLIMDAYKVAMAADAVSQEVGRA